MWRKHTSSLVILTMGVSSLFAAENQHAKSPTNCPRYDVPMSDDLFSCKAGDFKPLPAKRDEFIKKPFAKAIGKDITPKSIIEVSSDITTNQIWTAANTYHIVNDISVQALLVIEPGTIIKFAADTRMSINNGGVLISAGMPDDPITYTSDSSDPWYGDYYCPILIEETASASTKVTYSYIEYAFYGIEVVNNRLDSPIENNYFYKNAYGVVEYGTEHTDIIDNLFYSTYYYAIDVNLASVTSQGDADSYILIQNNTCHYYQDVGILVRGVSNPDDAGQATLTNNIVSGSYQYGVALVNGYMYYDLINTGYYDNEADKYDNYDEVNPVIETQMPYVDGTGTLPVCYLNPNSTFVNASDEYIEQTRLIGKTTDINGFPDSNKTDLGFHYPNWNFSNAGSSTLYADFDNNYKVDYNDLSEFADYWLYDYNYNYQCWWWDWFEDGVIDFDDLALIMDYWLNPYDFSDFADFAQYWRRQVDYGFEDKRFDLVADNIVDFRDFSKFAEQWGQETTSSDPNIQIQISGVPNDGYVYVSFEDWSPDTMRIFLLLNGQIVGGTYRFKDDESITIDISKYGNGEQQFKVVSVDSNGHLTCSNIANVIFTRPLNYCVLPKTYERNQPLPFAAYNSGAGDITVKAYAMGGSLVWSQTFTGNSIYGAIPAAITNQYEFDYVSFDNDSGQSLAKKVTDPKLPNFSENVQALIVLPNWWIRIHDYQIVWAVQNAFKYHGIIYATLSGSNATYENMRKYAQIKHIKYLYIGCTHGEFLILNDPPTSTDTPDNRRTNFDLYDPQGGDENYEQIVSIQRSDYSDPNMAPPWCCDLWCGGFDSVATMGFNYLEFAYFDFCYSGRLKINADNQLVQGQPGQQGIFDIPHSDMSFALGMAGSGRSNFYQGWYDKARSSIPPIWETEYQRWSRIEWYKLEEGMNLFEALYYVIGLQTDFGPDAPVNNYRLKGEGFLEDIELRNW